MDDDGKLLQRLWQPPQPSRRGPKAALSVSRIVEAAFDLACEHGVEALSMSRIATALDVSPMALYRHVSGKDELLALLADRVSRDLPEIGPTHTWREGLDRWTRAQIDLSLTYPWFLDLPLSTVMPGPNRLRWIDQFFGVMAPTPLDNAEKLALAGLIAQHVLGQARILIESGMVPRARSAEAARGSDDGGDGDSGDGSEQEPEDADELPPNPFAGLGHLLRTFGDPAAFPHLMASLDAADDEQLPLPVASPEPEATAAEEVTFGLEILLDGIEAYVARKTEATGAGRR